MKHLLLIAALLVAGCTTPVGPGQGAGLAVDKDTSYTRVDRPDGFTLTVNYDRYQFIPETAAVITSCKSALTSLAHDLAERQGRKIKPIDDQRIQISTGRNGLTGITSCVATAPAFWQ